MKQSLFRRLVWDYSLDQEAFESILLGKRTLGSFDQAWAIARVLENANYYEAIDLIPWDTLQSMWPVVKQKMFYTSIKDGYEYVLHRDALSTAR